MTNWLFGMVTILQFVAIKMSRKRLLGKNLKGRFASDFKMLQSFFLIFDKVTNTSPIVNCQIVNNNCCDKDLKEIFESDTNRLEVSFSSLTMQSSSIQRLNCKQQLLIIFKYVYNYCYDKDLKGSSLQMQTVESCLSHR